LIRTKRIAPHSEDCPPWSQYLEDDPKFRHGGLPNASPYCAICVDEVAHFSGLRVICSLMERLADRAADLMVALKFVSSSEKESLRQ
jgi:hypothetical protein